MKIRTAKELGALVRDARIRLGLSQARLAAEAQTTRRWIYEFEAGKDSVQLDVLLRVIETCGLQIEVSSAIRESVDSSFDLNAYVEGFDR